MTAIAANTTNGSAVKDIRPDLYHGIEVLRLHVGDPIPTPRAPKRFAVLVGPDLARYLLAFNHPNNRNEKPSAIAKYRRDMEQGYWSFTPESLVFSTEPIMEDGQNRLRAIEESGCHVWLMMDFGWPADLIERINRGSARTNADALTVNGYSNSAGIAAAVGIVDIYNSTVGTPLLWTRRLLSASEALDRYTQDPECWDRAGGNGRRAYESVRGLGVSTWAACFFVIEKAAGIGKATAFFDEFAAETGDPGAATRKLKSHYLRRKLTDTASGDRREPVENIIRAFNAWAAHKPVGFVRTGGAFVLSPVKSAR